MAREKKGETLTLMEAVDHLSRMSEIDLSGQIEGIERDGGDGEIDWTDPTQAIQNEGLIRQTFTILHKYLQNLVRKTPAILKEKESQRGIHALMLLAQEAVQKMDQFAALYPKEYQGISGFKEYKDLQKYYQEHLLKQIPRPTDEKEDWEEDLQLELKEIEMEKRGLRDLQSVRNDERYELFFIKSEEGRPYFSSDLLRHIRLLGSFDEFLSQVSEEDPLLKVRQMLDLELYEGATETLKELSPYIDLFHKEARLIQDHPLIGSVNKALMALRMAANPKCLIENQSFKSCLEYYADFHRFLREALSSSGYTKILSGEEKKNRFSDALIHLIHALCYFFFNRMEKRREGLSLLREMIVRGKELDLLKGEKEGLLSSMEEDMALRSLLRHYPNGPILRTIDMFREEEEYEGFDPLIHSNFPSEIGNLKCGKKIDIALLRIPCPTKQLYINEAHVVEEFAGFLRYCKEGQNQTAHLLINLQEGSAWQEKGRCNALEQFAKRAEFHGVFYLMSLSYDSPFYHQSKEYRGMKEAAKFIETFEREMGKRGASGFYLLEKGGSEWRGLDSFIREALQVVHRYFFGGRASLSRRERHIFIDLFYQFLLLKWVDRLEVGSMSFSCKDGVDIGPIQSTLLYLMVELLAGRNPFDKKGKEGITWILYSPALFIRERAPSASRVKRMFDAVELVQEVCAKEREKMVEGVNRLYERIDFSLFQAV